MSLLSLDVSTKTGFCFRTRDNLLETGQLHCKVEDFNVNADPDKSPFYPGNMLDAANDMGRQIAALIQRLNPKYIVVENTVKGRNRHTQRILEWLHFALVTQTKSMGRTFTYLDPSMWRKTLEIRLSKDQRKNNADVSKGKKRGRITKKHLSVQWANARFGLQLKIKDNDKADALGLSEAWYILNPDKN